MLRDLRTPAGLLVMVNFTLAVAMLTAAFAVNETSRRQVLHAIPLPGLDLFGVTRQHGKQDIARWRITAADLAALRQLDLVKDVSASEMFPVMAKYGRKHLRTYALAADQLEGSMFQTMHNKPPSDGWYLVTGRWLTAADVASAAQVCVLEKGTADELGIRQAGVTIRLNGFPFQVIGIKNNPHGDVSYMPMSTAAKLFAVTELDLRVLASDNRELVEKQLNPQLQRIFHTQDRFVLPMRTIHTVRGGKRVEIRTGFREALLLHHSILFKLFLTRSSVGLAPIGIALFGALGISVAWARERRWSYALFRALGATRGQVGRAALGGPLLVASGSSTLGLGLGWLICTGLAKFLAVEIAFYWLWFVIAWAVGFAAMLPAALYIALRAAFVQPAEALRSY